MGPTAPFEKGALGQDQVPGIECCADPSGLEQFDAATCLSFSIEFTRDDDFGSRDPSVDAGGLADPKQIRGEHLAAHAAVDPTGPFQRNQAFEPSAG